MGGLRWLDSMSVGRSEFDNDHQAVIAALAAIRTAIEAGEVGEAHQLVIRLMTLADDHILREEAFLRRIGFPGIEPVIKAQKDSLSKIAALADLIQAEPGKAATVIFSLEQAFVSYLLRADINFKSYVEAAGLRDVDD